MPRYQWIVTFEAETDDEAVSITDKLQEEFEAVVDVSLVNEETGLRL